MARNHFREDPRFIDLAGQRFGLWLVLRRVDRHERKTFWECRCDCGKFARVPAHHLRSGATRSCGCASKTRGGLSTCREFRIWSKMLARCHNPSHDKYRYYGARGIFVCRGWRGSFEDFLADLGFAPSAGHSIDRINTLGSYTCGKCEECKALNAPMNCRWSTKADQARNQRSNRYYTHEGKTLILKDWARLTGIKYLTLWNRLNTGYSFAEAISTGHYVRIRQGNQPRGERQHNAKLTAGKVKVIRERYAAGGITLETLAAEYEVSRETVGYVVRRKTWRHVD